MRKKFIPFSLFFGFIFFTGLLALPANAATRTVDIIADNGALTACTAAAGDCSLRGAITNAAAGDTINFDPGLTNATITLSSTIDIVRSVSIIGLGADKLTISGGGTTKLFNYFGGSTLSINFSNLTIEGGNGSGGHDNNQGGAMEINGGGTIAIFDSVYFRNNSASAIGGAVLFLGGECRVINSTFSGNSSPLASVIYAPIGLVRVTNSTFSGNSAGNFGVITTNSERAIIRNSTIVNNIGGLYKSGGTLTLGNTIVAGNSNFDLSNFNSSIVSAGGNLIGNNTGGGTGFAAGVPNVNADYVGSSSSPVNPQLAPLANNGGATPTHALLTGSPAINAGNNCVLTAGGCGASDPVSGLTGDQRGAPRAVGGTTDIGAVERNFTFDPLNLPNGRLNVFYNQTVTVNRSTGLIDFDYFGDKQKSPINLLAPFNFTVITISGENLPPGLLLTTGGQISGTPTTTGTFTFTVKATDADGLADAQKYTVQILSPTAANVSVAGRVLTFDGRGLQNAVVTMTDQDGNVRTARSSSFGYFSFADIPAGGIYVFQVISKGYQFVPQVVSVSEDIAELNLTANE